MLIIVARVETWCEVWPLVTEFIEDHDLLDIDQFGDDIFQTYRLWFYAKHHAQLIEDTINVIETGEYYVR